MQEILKILDAERQVMEFFYSMWDCVEREDFVDAMSQQFYFLYWTDEFAELTAKLNKVDGDFYQSLYKIALSGK